MSSRPPAVPPIGLRLARTARVVTHAYERAMADAGGSASVWQILLLVRSRDWGAQSLMAEAMGVTSATLTHHLSTAERQGLVRRWREPDNRRVQRVELTAEGLATFDRLREVAVRHDERLRSRFTDEELEQFAEFLDRLRHTIEEPAPAAPAAAPTD